MTALRLLLCASFCLATFTACTKSVAPSDHSSVPPSPAPEAENSSPLLAFESAETKPAEATRALRLFGARLFHEIQKNEPADGNLVISPWSVESTMLMVGLGAKGDTLAQIMGGLSFFMFPDSPPAMHSSFAELNRHILKAAMVPDHTNDGEKRIVQTANGIWVADQLQDALAPAFQTQLEALYEAEVHHAPFATQTENARQTINRWVAEHTNQHIPELFERGAIPADSSIVLTNAISFQADWSQPFLAHMTREQPFTTLTGNALDVAMMNQTYDAVKYWEGESFVGVELPYENGTFAMSIVIPEEGHFLAVRDVFFEGQGVNTLFPSTEQRETTRVRLSLPKFTFSWHASLVPALKGLGIEHAFEARANFSAFFQHGSYAIAEVAHHVFIAVDEKGTEAAAATGAVAMPTSIVVHETEPKIVRADRPFFFMIHDTESGTPIFVGQVLEPRIDN